MFQCRKKPLLTIFRVLPERGDLGDEGEVLLPVAGGQEDTVPNPNLLIAFLVPHHAVRQPLYWMLLLLKKNYV